MKILEGIQLYELILMILGFILGLALIFIFILTALRGNPNLKLLFGFIAPLIMIGYPSIQSIEFSKDVVKIDKLVQQVNKNPADTAAQKALVTQIQTLPASRCVTSSDAMSTIANAQAALGQYDSAKVTIQKAVVINPNNEKVVESQQQIQKGWQIQKNYEQKVDVIRTHLNNLEKNPRDQKIRDSVFVNLKALDNIPNTPVHLPSRDLVILARAAAISGEKQAANELVDVVLTGNSPSKNEAQKLKEDLKNKVIERQYPAKKILKPNMEEAAKRAKTEAKKLPPVVAAPAPVLSDSGTWRPKFLLKAAPFKKWDIRN